jgi:hypothetical protein
MGNAYHACRRRIVYSPRPRHAFKARINSNDALSEALQMSYQRVQASVAKNEEIDQGIKVNWVIISKMHTY